MPSTLPRTAALGLGLTLGLAGCAASDRPEVAYVPSYCYRSLADVQCYLTADAGREGQLTAVQVFKEGDPATTRYWQERLRIARERDLGRVEADDDELEAIRGEPPTSIACEASRPCAYATSALRTAGAIFTPTRVLIGAAF